MRAERVLATQGPQPYALVALGRFNGTLQSRFNPAAAAAGAAPAPCRIVVAVITAGPSGLTNQTRAARRPRWSWCLGAAASKPILTASWVIRRGSAARPAERRRAPDAPSGGLHPWHGPGLRPTPAACMPCANGLQACSRRRSVDSMFRSGHAWASSRRRAAPRLLAALIPGARAAPRSAPSFRFRAQAGAGAGAGFECSLAAAGRSGTDAYAPCSSPATFGNLSDGRCAFRVRALGEQVADSRSFIKVAPGPEMLALP